MAARHGGALALCTRPIYEGNEIGVVQINALNAELRCPICLNLLRQPVATECMHRFCAGCIEKCLRVGKKECPTCRKPVATRRNLRTDHNFMAIITKLYPDLEDFEQEEDALIDNVASRARMVAITAEQQQEMIEHQRNNPPSPHHHAANSNAAKRPRGQGGSSGHGHGGHNGHNLYESDGMDESDTEEGRSSESFDCDDDEGLEDGEGEEEDDDDDEVQRPHGGATSHGLAAAPRRSHKKQMRPSIPAGRKQLGHDARNVLTPRPNEVRLCPSVGIGPRLLDSGRE